MECKEGDATAVVVGGDGGSGEEQVMSEVHLGCPPNHSGSHISYFTISVPPRCEEIEDSLDSVRGKVYEVDEDGDLILTRRRSKFSSYNNLIVKFRDLIRFHISKRSNVGGRDAPKNSFVIRIRHNITSSIPRVGLQVWRAELVLADFVLHMAYKSSDFDRIVAVELGAGTGMVGMLLARFANTVFITDKGNEVLRNCVENIRLNSGIFHRDSSIYVRELDWNRPWPPEVVVKSPAQQSYGWRASEVEELQRASLLLAADVIYSDDLTDAFFSVLQTIMSTSREKVLYLALEKRYNFTIDDLDVVANGYLHFRSYIQDEDEEEALGPECPRSFMGRRINLEEIPQYVHEYDQGNDVEIWQIRYVEHKS